MKWIPQRFMRPLGAHSVGVWRWPLLIALLVMGGCTTAETVSPSPTPTSIPSKAVLTVSENTLSAVREDDGRLLWTRQGPGNGAGGTFPCITSAGHVFWATPAGIFAYASNTGHLLWKTTTSGSSTALVVDDQRVYVATDTTLAAFSIRDGSLQWQQSAGIPISSLWLFQQTLYASNNDTLQAFDGQTGKQQWNNENRYTTAYTVKTLLFFQDLVIVIRSNYIVALRANTGQPVWSLTDESPSVNGTESSVQTRQSYLDLSTNTLYLLLFLGDNSSMPRTSDLAAYDPQTGKQRWTREDKATTDTNIVPAEKPALLNASGLLAVSGTSDGDLHRRQLTDGQQVWNLPGTGTYHDLHAATGVLLAQSEQGPIDTISIDTGKRLWSRDAAATSTVWTPTLTPYLVQGKTLSALDPHTGTPRWQTRLDSIALQVIAIP